MRKEGHAFALFTISMLLSVLNVTYVQAFDWDTFELYERDAEGDVIYFSYETFDFVRAKDRPDIDISSLRVGSDGKVINVTLKVYGRIRSDEDHEYYFSGDLSHYDTTDPDIMLTFKNGFTILSFENNFSAVNLTESTFLKNSTLIISLPIEYFRTIVVFELQAFATEYDHATITSYTDSTEPIEEIASDGPYPLFQITAIVLILFFIGMVFYYFMDGRQRLRTLRNRMRKRCPVCGVLYGWGSKECAYCEVPLELGGHKGG